MEGWIKLHRRLKDHWIWQDAERLKWWLDILMEANHETRKVLLKGKLVECKRGQCVKSLETWAKEWRTTKKTVHRFLGLLEKDAMIRLESVTVSTRLTICNYDSYQDEWNAKGTQTTRRRHADDTQTTPKQELEELKEGKNIPADAGENEIEKFKEFQLWVKENAPRVAQMKEPFTFRQWRQSTERFGKFGTIIKSMHNWEPLLKKNRSAYLTLCSWKQRELEKQTA